MFKLCFKSYSSKLTLGAMKQFKNDTDEDLSFTLSRVLECWSDSEGMSMRHRINTTYSVVDFELAAYAFLALANGDGGRIPLEEIEDAMFHVGSFPNAIDNEFSLPWPLVLVKLAQDVEKEFEKGVPRKKSDIVEL